MRTDILIVGGGLAGRRAAAAIRRTAPELDLLLLDAGGGASTEIMGFSAPVEPGDSPEQLRRDTLGSGGGYSDPELVRVLADGALPALRELEAAGIAFDRRPDGAYDTVAALGTAFPRVVHAGTSTGKLAMKLPAVPVRNGRAVRLLLSGGRIAGACLAGGETVAARAVILAGGGFAGLWKCSTWSKSLRGDCLTLALDAGAELRDLRFVQFEPAVTRFPEPWAGFPIITTVLTEGAQLLDREGKSLLEPGKPLPRKRELALLIRRTVKAGMGLPHGGVRFDFSGVDEAGFAARYPEYFQKFRSLAPTLKELRFEVAPGAHTTLGGIAIAPDASTRIPGLFAAGEAAGGIHGRDRLGGNAGLEVLVFGRIAGESAARYVERVPFAPLPEPEFPPETPPELYERLGELLDRRYPADTAPETVREGLEELKRFPEYPPVKLVRRMFREFLEHAREIQSGRG